MPYLADKFLIHFLKTSAQKFYHFAGTYYSAAELMLMNIANACP